MLALLRTRRWISFTLIVVLAIVGFGLLSRWQWHRAEEHRLERIMLDTALTSAPQPLPADGSLPEWTPVTVTGTYLPQDQAMVRKRPMEARNGFWLMTALQGDTGRVVWVNRGWLPVGGDALDTPAFPVPPAGEVTVTGYTRTFEDAAPDANTGLPAGQIAAPALALLPAADGVDSASSTYVQLSESVPAQEGLVPLPLPELEVDEGRNISYAIQWILFAVIAIGGWFFFLRREARDVAAEEPPMPTASTSGVD